MEYNALAPNNVSIERQCAVSKEIKSVSDMIRFVKGPDGEVVPDLKRNLPGRGVWVTVNKSLLERALTKKIFDHGFKSKTSANTELPDQVERLLQKHALGSLGMARKAGLVLTGFTKSNSAVRAGKAVGVIHASDASNESLNKLKGAILACYGDVNRIPLICMFTTDQLNETLGGANIVNVALLNGRASTVFVESAGKLEKYRTGTAKLEK